MEGPLRFAGGCVALATRKSPAREGPNEDALAAVPLGSRDGVLILADGVGGCPAGRDASRLAVTTIAQAVAGLDSQAPEQVRAAVLGGIEAANEVVLGLGSGAATTLAVVQIADGVAQSFHVGDSPILVTGQRGRIRQYVMAHSPTGYAAASGVVIEEDDPAWYAENRHLVSNIVGSRDMHMEIGPRIRLQARDTVLIASDGLTDNLPIEQVVERVRKGPIERALCGLMEETAAVMAGDSGHPDDLTVILYRPTCLG
ncbi:PP2C family protein-serine/threonine phosphatase [Thiohalobacter sp.]|uniref:PP2C family protein-serine/threonine phosphatase n=1 Tax=Thiohalobacter sp. TaxID=2025948 RepID=UPI00262B52E7|nr:protein phosphatase 2C domain-containing protein [Thiohalobacter sp.]